MNNQQMITDEKPATSITTYVASSNLTAAEQRQAKEIASGLDLVNDPNGVSRFALSAQEMMARSTEPLLRQVRSKDTGEVGVLLRDLLTTTGQIDPTMLEGTSGVLVKLPVIGGFFNKAAKYVQQFEKVGDQIERLAHKLEGQVRILDDDVVTLEQLFDDNYDHFQMLQVYIAAGEMKIRTMQSQHRVAVRKAEHSGKPFDTQEAADLGNLIARFERRIHDLKLSAVLAVQTAPQIRMIQASNTALGDKIQSSLMITLPLWKQQFVIAMALYRQKNGLELQRQVAQKTNDLLLANSQMLNQGTVAIAAEVERGVVDIETLKTTQAALVATIGEVLQIQETGRQQRAVNEVEMKQLEKGLQKELLQLQSTN